MKNSENNLDVEFPKFKDEVLKVLLTLNKHEGFKVTALKNGKLKIVYDGGYNNVYKYICYVDFSYSYSIHEKWFYWNFEVKSDIHETKFEVCNLGWQSGFMDFFIDEHIKEVGSILSISDYE